MTNNKGRAWTSNPALFFLIAVLLLIMTSMSETQAQERFAIGGSAECWGEVLNASGLTPGSIWTGECWVYLFDDNAEEQHINSKAPVMNNGFTLQIHRGNPHAGIMCQSEWIEITGMKPVALGAWTHLAMTFENGVLSLFLNGELQGTAVGTRTPEPIPGALVFSSAISMYQVNGFIDETRFSDTLIYTGNFDPFNIPMVDLRVGDQEVPSWELGTGPGDLQEAWDYNSLYDIIDGAAVVYINHNFQYAVQQLYYGTIGGNAETLTWWMTDQGTPEDAQELYHDPMLTPFFYQSIDTIGSEARLDTGLLFDWALDFWRDKYYVKLIVSKEWDEEEALEVITQFAFITDQNILNRDHFKAGEHTLALWHFDEGSGSDFFDISGHGYDGTLTNPAWVETTPYEKVLYITSADLLDGVELHPEIDADDTARVAFSDPVLPVNIHAGNIDDMLQLSGGHSWLSGSGELGNILWNATMDTLKISFSLEVSAPTLANNDTITPNPGRLASQDTIAAGGYRFIRFEDISSTKPGTDVFLPEKMELYAPFPTPFNATTKISFALPHREAVSLSVYDLWGREIDCIQQGMLDAGVHRYIWNASDFASGIYFIVLASRADRKIQKTVLLK